MNTGTLTGSLVMAAVVAVLTALVVRQMMRGWRHRAERQAALIGELPSIPDVLGAATVAPTPGLYVGSTLAEPEPDPVRTGSPAPGWLDRVAAADLGHRAKAVLTRYPEGILLDRSGAGPIWIPQAAITAIRTERGIAGKVIVGGGSAAAGRGSAPHGGILAIRWRLPSGTEIDTGFRGDDRREYARWLEEAA
jgi:hypothetical protein